MSNTRIPIKLSGLAALLLVSLLLTQNSFARYVDCAKVAAAAHKKSLKDSDTSYNKSTSFCSKFSGRLRRACLGRAIKKHKNREYRANIAREEAKRKCNRRKDRIKNCLREYYEKERKKKIKLDAKFHKKKSKCAGSKPCVQKARSWYQGKTAKQRKYFVKKRKGCYNSWF